MTAVQVNAYANFFLGYDGCICVGQKNTHKTRVKHFRIIQVKKTSIGSGKNITHGPNHKTHTQ